MSGVDLQTATGEDVETCRDLFYDSYNDLHRRFGMPQEDPSDAGWLVGALRHLLETDPEGTVLAVDGTDPLGFASSYRRGRLWFLSFLFVAPSAQGRGIGRLLLQALLPPASEDRTRALVVESFQPVSTGLYAGHGIVPLALRYRLGSVPDLGRLPRLPRDVAVEELDGSSRGLGELDRRLLGYERDEDHRWWLASGMPGRAYRRGGRLVGYGYRSEGFEDVCPVLAEDGEMLGAIVADLLRASPDPSSFSVPLYGNARDLFAMLARCGARIEPEESRFVYCSDGDPPPPTYVGYTGYLV